MCAVNLTGRLLVQSKPIGEKVVVISPHHDYELGTVIGPDVQNRAYGNGTCFGCDARDFN